MKKETLAQNSVSPNPGMLIVIGFVTFLAVVLTFFALDDITTDRSIDFTFEYGILLICALWCVFILVGMITHRRTVSGIISLIILFGAMWSQRGIGPGTVPGFQPEYIITVLSLVWFLLVSFMLLFTGFRRLVS